MTIENPAPQNDVLQLTPYNAKYDAGPHITKTEADARKTEFAEMIRSDMPRLINGRDPKAVTHEELVAWLHSSYARFFSVSSEVALAVVSNLREQLSKIALIPNRVFLCNKLLDSLQLPWGFDEFGKEHNLRRTWENVLYDELKVHGCTPEILAFSKKLGGYFATSESIMSSSFLEMLECDFIQEDVAMLTERAEEITYTMPMCNSYKQRLDLLVPFRLDVLTTLRKYLNHMTTMQPGRTADLP
jgi:hypothetical protein